MSARDWSAWIGRETRASDRMDEALARRWHATFDLDLAQDDALEHGIHFCLCTPEAPTRQLGEDGHPRRDDSPDSFFPPIDLPRRMWAASDIEFAAPIRLGDAIERISQIVGIEEKQGKSGRLGFVEVDHRTFAGGALAVRERQTLVYREAAARDAPLSPPPPSEGQFDASAWERSETVLPDERLLFRFSALTFNTHRIHYDAPYAREVERYRALVVHGPLMASLLLQLASRQFGRGALESFAFRAVSPALAGEPLHLALRRGDSGGAIEMGTFAPDGRQCVRASARLRASARD